MGDRIINANGTQRLKSNKIPTAISESARKGIKYPVLAIAVIKSMAGCGNTAVLGKNFITPNNRNPNPIMIRIMV